MTQLFRRHGPSLKVTAPAASSSAATAINASAPHVRVCNTGAVPISIAFGGSGLVSTALDQIVPPTTCVDLDKGGCDYFAVWSDHAATTAVVYVTPGEVR